MESEHVKASNENVQKAPEMKPEEQTPSIEQVKNQELSSPPPNSPMEVHSDDDDKKGPDDNPSTNPELKKRDSSSSEEELVPPQVLIPASPETPTQISSPEPTEMKSPPMQVMGQSPGYDPNRIPASVFSTKNNGDWSATSNESLFSIHMGNNSFSRDYAILFGKSGEFSKTEDCYGTPMTQFMISGELPRLDDWSNSPPLPNQRPNSQGKSNESGGLPPVMEDPMHEESSLLSEFPEVEKKAEDTSFKNQEKQNRVSSEALSVSVPKKPPVPETNYSSLSNPTSIPSPNRFSDVSVHSGSSFAFPVLGSHDSGKNESVKVVPERMEKSDKGDQQQNPQNQAQVSTETPAGGSGTRWFSCFSCWPRFC